MDSGNSGSFQSSTGDEEFDSHGGPISALLNNIPAAATYVSSLSNKHRQQILPSPPPSSYMYEHHLRPLSPPQPIENNPKIGSFMNLYSTEVINPNLASEYVSQSHHHKVSQPPIAAENTGITASLQEPPPPQEARKSRKRPRASRGAGTTVLTTDTTNFRAMVQEFTGIPEPPFPYSSPFQKPRLDNFGTVSGIRSMNASYSLPPPPYLLRPSPQKVHSPFSSILDHAFASSNTNNMNSGVNLNTANALTSFNNGQFSPQNSSLFNIPNKFIPSFLEPRFPQSNSSFRGTKPHQEKTLDFSSFDDFGGEVNTSMPSGLHGLFSSDQRTSRNNNQADGSGVNRMGSKDDDQILVITSATNNNFSLSSS